MYSINCNQDTFMKEYGVPEGVEITHTPYNGTPFSAYTTLSHKGKTLDVQFGVGGYYADIAMEYVKDFFAEEREQEEQPLPNAVTAIIHNDSNQLLYVMDSSGEWELPWSPITAHENNDHEVYSTHEVNSMMSLADMLLSTLGVKVSACQWVSTGVYKPDGEDYEVTLVSSPVVDNVKTMWY